MPFSSFHESFPLVQNLLSPGVKLPLVSPYQEVFGIGARYALSVHYDVTHFVDKDVTATVVDTVEFFEQLGVDVGFEPNAETLGFVGDYAVCLDYLFSFTIQS